MADDLRNQIPQDRSVSTMEPFPQPITNPKFSGIAPGTPMQTITLPGGQTVQIPKINVQEINAKLGRMFDSPMMTASAPAITRTPVDLGNSVAMSSGELTKVGPLDSVSTDMPAATT